ncbi:MAG: hypothetical protein ACE37H_14360 [Phycisphaeraceae bacterium]
MTTHPSGTGYPCAPKRDTPAFTQDDIARLQDYLFELEATIAKLAVHIAELESALHTLDNERQVRSVAEAGTRGDAASGHAGASVPGVRPAASSSRTSPILFRFDPRNLPARPNGPRDAQPSSQRGDDPRDDPSSA